MGTLIVAIIGLALAQLAVIAKLAHWAGQREAEIRGLRAELEEVKKRPALVERVIERTSSHEIVETAVERRFRQLEENIEDRERADALDKLRTDLVHFVNKVSSGWGRALARVGWRLENVEMVIKQKLGSKPRMFAVRDEPPLLETGEPPESPPPGSDELPPTSPPPPPRRR